RAQGHDRLRRPQRAHARLRGSGLPALRAARGQRRARRGDRTGVPVHADRQPALARAGLDVRHPGGESPGGDRRRAGARRARRGAALAQRHRRRSEARLARARARRDPGRPHARRPAPPARRRQRRGADARHERRVQRQVSRGARPRRPRARRDGLSLPLLPVFANLLPADADMQALIARLRAPWATRLAEPLAVTEGLLYRRGNFGGTWDQLLLDALMTVKGAEIALSPGFRWGSTLLPGQTITLDDLMSQTALTYPQTTLTDMTGEALKRVLEDVCDNLFNPDPYYRQGGDMLRVGGLTYACEPAARAGRRISDLRIGRRPPAASRR